MANQLIKVTDNIAENNHTRIRTNTLKGQESIKSLEVKRSAEASIVMLEVINII